MTVRTDVRSVSGQQPLTSGHARRFLIELRGRMERTLVSGGTVVVVVLCEHRRLKANLLDVGDSDEAEPIVEEVD